MRPTRLEVEGFTAFRERTELDLGSLDLFAITGKTGAGKSSLIDAIAYALYGRIPRVSTQVADCISQGLKRMAVTLEFTAGADEFRVFRETRRQGAPNVRLEQCVDGDWHALEHSATAVNKRIETIIGLTYDAFTRSVLLPQGQFQDFLSGSPEKRREVLQSLLRTDVYVRMQKRAGDITNQKKNDLARIQSLLDQVFANATPENLHKAEDELEVVRGESARLQELMPLWQEAVRLAQAYRHRLQAQNSAEAERSKTLALLDSARKVWAQSGAKLAALNEAVEATDNAIRANAFDADLMTALTNGANLALTAESSAKRAREMAAGIKARQTAFEGAERQAVAAQAALDAAAAALDAAQHELIQAQRGNLAAALQGGLAPGDACPVCGGKVAALPPIAAPDLKRSETTIAHARTEHDQSLKAHTVASQAQASARTALEGARENADQWQRQAIADRKRLEEALPGIEDRSAASLQAALRLQREAREERQQLNKRLAEASAALIAATQQSAQTQSELAARESLLKIQDAAVASACTAVADALSTLTAFAEKAGLETLCTALQDQSAVDDMASTEAGAVSERHAELQKDIGRLENLVDTLKDNIEKRAEVEKDQDQVRDQLNVAEDLWRMLGALKFQAFVQQEALRLLAENGSRRLQALSGDRYRLCINEAGRDFEVIDQWNADDHRPVRTLSGGETFLASLALSLAMAESMPSLAADRRVSLEALFLDEGFGSLDPDALEYAAEALDSLRDGNRMVCVVTHLNELAHRMPARIVVQKAETGSHAAIAL
ncbi:MAG TPA: SMC family ATPase [Dehalococcoidia bacterium]